MNRHPQDTSPSAVADASGAKASGPDTGRRLAIGLFALGLAALGLWLLDHASAAWAFPRAVRGVLAGLAAGSVSAALMLWWLPDPFGLDTPVLRRRLLWRLGLALVAFVALDVASGRLRPHADGAAWLQAAIVLLPALPVAWAFWAVGCYIRGLDELQQRLELQAIGVAAASAWVAGIAGAMLHRAKLIALEPDAAMLHAAALMTVVYGVCRTVLARRYR